MAPPDKKGDDDVALAGTAISSPDARIDSRRIEMPERVDPMIGRTIAERYQVLSLLGRGGMGSVYVSEHIQLKKRVALKVLAEELSKQPELVTRFLKEARAAAQIGHPNIVDVFDLEELPEGGAFIAMALLQGHDLQAEIEKRGVMASARARVIVGEICRALAAAHSKGIVHRDMKPANVFLSLDADGREQVKILDFGIAQIQEASGDEARLTQTGAIVGTPTFMSPEQARGERPDHRADIYSVGCILYNLITGQPPFGSTTLMGVLTKHLFEQPEAPSKRNPEAGITPELDALVLRALAKDPNDRFQTMKEMWTALETASGETAASWMESSSGRFVKLHGLTPLPNTLKADTAITGQTSGIVPPQKSRAGLVIGMLAVLCVCGGVAFVAFRHAAAAVATSPSIVPTTTPTPGATPAPVGKPTPTPDAPDITVSVTTTPSGATVFDGTRQIGVTPLRLVRPRGSEAMALRVALSGYADESLSLELDHDRTVNLPLRAETRTTAMKPGHAPEPQAKPSSVKKAGRKGDLKDPFAQ